MEQYRLLKGNDIDPRDSQRGCEDFKSIRHQAELTVRVIESRKSWQKGDHTVLLNRIIEFGL